MPRAPSTVVHPAALSYLVQGRTYCDTHEGRTTNASMLIAQDRSVIEVQDRFGHDSATETLDTYSHLFPDHEDGTREAVDNVRGERSSARP